MAKFLDHLLQSIVRANPDYLHNSASLSLISSPRLSHTSVCRCGQSIPLNPQTECLSIIYDELHSHRHLLFDPNLVIRLLINVCHNYFEFSTYK